METKNKTAYFEWLRIFAAAAVVIMHTEGSLWPVVSVQSRDFAVLTAWDALVRWPVPVFVMITGALFLPRKTALRTILTRYIPRMAAAFLFWSGFYALWAGGDDLLLRMVTGHYHLWYLPFLCGVYLSLPFLQKIATEDTLTWQLLTVSLVIGVGLPWLGDLAALCFPEQSAVIGSLKNSLHFTFFFDLLAVVLLGHWLNSHELDRKYRWMLYTAGVLCAVLTLPLTLWASAKTGNPNPIFCQITAPTTLCTAAALFVFAKYNLTRLPRSVEWMARRSFGVYLIHVWLLEYLESEGIHAMSADPCWTIPVLAAAVFALSLFAAELLHRIPVVGKYLA